MKNTYAPPRIIFTVFANEKLEETEKYAFYHDRDLRELIEHTDYKHAFTLMQIRSVNDDIGEEGVGEWAIKDASDWACKNMNNSFGIGLNAIYDEDKRYPTWFVFKLLASLMTNRNEFRVDQTVHITNDESFIKWSNENLVDEQNNPVSANH
jgi:hypothetical protein